jgi:hypothetical protein
MNIAETDRPEIIEAYIAMFDELKYRPNAASYIRKNLSLGLEEIDQRLDDRQWLVDEANDYASRFIADARSSPLPKGTPLRFAHCIGCVIASSEGCTPRTLVWTAEAMRLALIGDEYEWGPQIERGLGEMIRRHIGKSANHD